MFVCGGHYSSRLLSFGKFHLVFLVRLIYNVREVIFLSDVCIKRVVPAILQRVMPSIRYNIMTTVVTISNLRFPLLTMIC